MNDLTPTEQARAARWVKDWLLKCEFVESETAQDAITALGFYVDRLDPPETAESLRAERDKALEDVRYWRKAAKDEHEARGGTEQALAEAKSELARLRVLMRAATATPREHWLGGDHSNQTSRDGAE